MRNGVWRVGLWLLLSSTAGCDESSVESTSLREMPLAAPITVAEVPAPLPSAYCEVNVIGTGVVDLEEVYLPGVVTCENGGANIEALKAQAIAARSVAYYNMAVEGEICDSQGCQVFSCNNEPSAEAIQAVQETSGQYLMFNDTLTYGFYVAGDNNTSGPGCVGVSGSTEQWVTYNSGRSGTNVEQTELGFVHPTDDPSYGQNRGCMGQWGARCLENENGADYMDILRFYYGEDIEVVQAEGECVLPGETSDTANSETGDMTGGDMSASQGDDGGDEAGDDGASSGGFGTDGPGEPGGDDSEGGDTAPPGAPTSASGDGMGGDDGDALPAGFGEDADNSACNCTSGAGGRDALGVMALLALGLRRRRRTRKPRPQA